MKITLSDYILYRLKELHVETVFGIPGDYVLPFFDRLLDGDHGVQHIGTCNELNAAYCADGYAKLHGFGAAAVTFGPGSLNATNAVAGAYADDTPFLLIAGAPAVDVLCTPTQKLLHHVIDTNFNANIEVFTPITCVAKQLRQLETATSEVDSVIKKVFQTKKPAYLEIPYNLQLALVDAPIQALDLQLFQSSQSNLIAAVERTLELIRDSSSRSVIAGHLLVREKLVPVTTGFIEAIGATVATTFCGKIPDFEGHPNNVGIYMGKMCQTYTQETVEQADLLINFGRTYNEFDTGIFTAQSESNKHVIHALHDHVLIDDHRYDNVFLREFIPTLASECSLMEAATVAIPDDIRRFAFEQKDAFLPTDAALTIDRLFIQLINFFKKGDIVYGDTGGYINCSQGEFPAGVALFGCGNWGSLGSGFGMFVGGTLSPHAHARRCICITGDGAFQMTAQELSTLIRNKANAVVMILDNAGYGAERAIYPGKYRSYNDIQVWNYEQLGTAFGGTNGTNCQYHIAQTEKEMDTILKKLEAPKGVHIVRIHLEPNDSASFNLKFSEALRH